MSIPLASKSIPHLGDARLHKSGTLRQKSGTQVTYQSTVSLKVAAHQKEGRSGSGDRDRKQAEDEEGGGTAPLYGRRGDPEGVDEEVDDKVDWTHRDDYALYSRMARFVHRDVNKRISCKDSQ